MPSDFGSHMLKMVKPQDKVAQVLHHCLEFATLYQSGYLFQTLHQQENKSIGFKPVYIWGEIITAAHYINQLINLMCAVINHYIN